MECKTLHFSRHAFERMFQRGINPAAITRIVAEAEIIFKYPDDKPYPSVLLLRFYGKQAVHAVVAQANTGDCHLVTIYWPDPAIWDESFIKKESMMKCTICKTGQTHPGTTTVTLQRDNSVVVIRDVPAEICENCGEYYLSEPVASRVFADADETARRHVEVEIQRYAA